MKISQSSIDEVERVRVAQQLDRLRDTEIEYDILDSLQAQRRVQQLIVTAARMCMVSVDDVRRHYGVR